MTVRDLYAFSLGIFVTIVVFVAGRIHGGWRPWMLAWCWLFGHVRRPELDSLFWYTCSRCDGRVDNKII